MLDINILKDLTISNRLNHRDDIWHCKSHLTSSFDINYYRIHTNGKHRNRQK